MDELLHLNRYLHDFTAAMWVCGSILVWFLCREGASDELTPESERFLQRLAGKFCWITIPSLVVSLASGGVRAMTFKQYEHPGELDSSLITMLIVKHVVFAVFVAWGIAVHLRSRGLGTSAQSP